MDTQTFTKEALKTMRTPATQTRLEALTAALIAAKQEAEDAKTYNSEDGGTCNMDSAVIRLPRWDSDLVQKAAEAAGVRLYKGEHFGRKVWFLSCYDGQANLRSRMAQAAKHALDTAGFECFVYYQMD